MPSLPRSAGAASPSDSDAARDPLSVARDLVPVLERTAGAVDAEAVFPEESVAALRASGLMGLVVPREHGGFGASWSTMSDVGRILGEACMSTALIWGMHCQQVAVLVDHAPDPLRERVLPKVARGETYIASVTSERGKGGHLLSAEAPLARDGDSLVLDRDAPVVTGGLHADAFLITMRADAEAPPSEVRLVWAERDQLQIDARSNWDPMGARGTHSVALSLKGRVDAGQIVGSQGFRDVAITSMIPVGHIAWASGWLGAATGALRRMIAVFRDPKMRGGLDISSDLFATELARVRLELATTSAYLRQAIGEYERLRAASLKPEDFESPGFQMQINELKVVASERLFAAIDRLVQLSGLRFGYLKTSPVPLERVFRDLRSAAMMYGNDRLLIANGKLALLDRDVSLP